MPGQEQAIHEDVVQPQITEAQVGQLFGDHDNIEIFNQILDQSPDDHLAELTAAYFTRPHYINGSAPPDELPPDHPLYQGIMGLDLETVEDPVQKQVFGQLQTELVTPTENSDSETRPQYKKNALAAMLVPGLIEKYGIGTSAQIYDVAKDDMFRFGDVSPSHTKAHADILASVTKKITSETPDPESHEAFSRLLLSQKASEAARAFSESKYNKLTSDQRDEFKTTADDLKQVNQAIVLNDLGLEPKVAELTFHLINNTETSKEATRSQYDFRTITKKLEVLSHSELGSKLLEKPSPALAVFVNEIVGSNNPDMAISAGASVILDSYAQASKLSDPVLIDHYKQRVVAFLRDIEAISSDPEVLEQYKQFIESNQNSSVKQQVRTARVFKSLKVFGMVDIESGDAIEDVEAKVINNFLEKLMGDEVDFSSEETTRLVEAFGEVAPLFTYAQHHIGKPEWKQALGELTRAVASGNYSQWRRGDGSSEALESMKEAGYLPSNLTLEQYQEWLSDRTFSSEEELISSAEDTALAIREAMKQASVDIDMLAPGYTIDEASLAEVVEVRNGLGKMTGLLHKAMKNSGEGVPLSQESIDEIQASLSEHIADSREVQNLIGLLKNGTDPAEVSQYLNTTRGHMDQLRLLIRIANITPEEIVAGALLSEPDENGKRKAQEQLFETLNELRLELPDELKFIPDTALRLLTDHAQESGEIEVLSVEDTVDPQVTIEIGETPQRSCQHYETGGFNEGLIGYFGPEVKIAIVRNAKGGIIARVITRLMEDENGDPVIYSEPIYQSVTSSKVGEMVSSHLDKKAQAMGIEHLGAMSEKQASFSRPLKVKALKMPAVYSDSGGGIQTESMTVRE